MFFYESDVMAHKAMTGHYQFEKRGEQDKNEESRQDVFRQLEERGISIKGLDSLPDGDLRELLRTLRRANKMAENEGK